MSTWKYQILAIVLATVGGSFERAEAGAQGEAKVGVSGSGEAGNVTYSGSGLVPGGQYVVQVINYSTDPDGHGPAIGPHTTICVTASASNPDGSGGGTISGTVAPPQLSAGDRVHFKVFAKGATKPVIDILVEQVWVGVGGTGSGGGQGNKKFDFTLIGNIDLAIFKVVTTGVSFEG